MNQPVESRTALTILVAVLCLSMGTLAYGFNNASLSEGTISQQASIISQFLGPVHNATVGILGQWQSTDGLNTIFTFNLGGVMQVSYNGGAPIKGSWSILQAAGTKNSGLTLAESTNNTTYSYSILSTSADTLTIADTDGQTFTYKKINAIRAGSRIFGTWTWNNTYTTKTDSRTYTTANDSFTLTLLPGTTPGTVVGTYTATYKSPSHIDGCPRNTNCVTGQIVDSGSILTFTSNRADGTGGALISYNPGQDTLQWTVQNKPANGYYAPNSAVLTRKY